MTTKENQKLGVKPLPGYLLIEPSSAEIQTASGIYLPETAQEKPAQGKVLAVGDSYLEAGKEISSPVKIGDTVIFKKWGGDEVRIKGDEYKLVKFDDLMAVLED